MDEGWFDRWTRGLGEPFTRRRLASLATGAMAALGLVGDADAKKKKKKKKKQDPPASTCGQPLDYCSSDAECCLTHHSPAAMICRPTVRHPQDHAQCCLPHHAPVDDENTACCGGYSELAPGGSGFRCCIEDALPDEGTPQFCCFGGQSVGGICCVAPGNECFSGQRCCGGALCPPSRVC